MDVNFTVFIDKINGYIARLRERLEELQVEPDWI